MNKINQSSNIRSIAIKLLNVIGDTPFQKYSKTTLIANYNEVAIVLDNTESKITAHYNLIDTVNGGNIKHNYISYINQLILYSLVLDDHLGNQIQKAYILQRIKNIGNYEQRNLLHKQDNYHGYDIPAVFKSVATQPKTESDDIEMITLSKFYTSVRNKLDLRRYPKTKVRSIGLSLMPDIGNFRKWYYGISHDPKGEEKITWIPYLNGDKVSLDSETLNEINELDLNDRQRQTLSTIGQQWNINEFKHEREPIDISTIQDRFAFMNPMPNVVNLPIKMAGDNEVYLPSEYEGMVEALSKIIAYEKANNPSYSDYYAYLTVDKTFVRKGSSQSRFVYHVDGFQSAEQTEMTVQRNYYVTNIVPNKYVLEPMETKGLIGDTIGEYYESFTYQAQYVEKMESIPLHIYLYDAYQVHSPTLTMATTDKTTLRVSFTQRQLNTLGNGINPLIPYEWTYTPNTLEAEVT